MRIHLTLNGRPETWEAAAGDTLLALVAAMLLIRVLLHMRQVRGQRPAK